MRFFLFFLAAAGVVLGQVTSGSISGYVMDPSNRPIAGVSLTALDPGHAVARQSTTDLAGFYRFLDLPPGVYAVSVSAKGFEPTSAKDMRVEVNSQVRADFHPVISGKGESVTVRAQVRTLATESSDLGTVMERSQIDSLPLLQRDFLQLAMLTPGVLPPVQNSELSTRGNFAMHANGAREEYNDFLLDGVDNNDADVNRYTLQPPIDAIQEFKISTNCYSAEYGRSAGGQVNVITRSGSNEFHGFLYEYLRNRVLDARNFFDPSEKPKYVRNQFGGGVGGPMVRNRFFFFANADGLTLRQGFSRLATVPTAAERSGDLSSLGSPIFDPFTGQPFPGNQIPSSRIDPIASKILSLYPLPNLGGAGGNYLGQPVGNDSESQLNVRGDYRVSDTDQITLRYSYGRNHLLEPFAEASTQIPGFGDYVYDTGHNAMIHELHTFGPRSVNSLILGFNRALRQVLPQNHTTDVNQLWGVNYLPARSVDFGYPAVAVQGFPQVGDLTSLPIDRAENTYQLTDVLSLVRGNHGIKIGAEFRKLEHNGILDIYARGQLSFTGALSGSGMSDLLLGLPTLGIQSQFNNQQTLRVFASNFFVQDDWKLRPNLTLNLGLRYEYNTPPTDPFNRMSVFDLATQQVYQVGTHGLSRSGIQPDVNNFAPRIGFAWSPAANLVVSGGYGIYYDAGMFTSTTALNFNPPYFTIRVFFPTQTSLLTLANPFPLNGGFVPPASLSTISRDFVTPYVQDWNFNVQRDFRAVGTLSVAYAGSKGTHLLYSRDLNQPLPGDGPLYTRAPYPNFSNIFFEESAGNSEFQSLQVTFNRPLAHGLSFTAVYMFSKSMDDTSAFLGTQADTNFPQNSHNYRLEHALSSFDMPQRFTAAWVYQTPARNWLTRNSEVRSILTVQDGQPFTPIVSFDNSNTGNSQFGFDRPNVVGNPNLSDPTPQEWFNTAAFQIAPKYTFGSAGRNILRGPGLASFDLSLVRRFHIAESHTVSFEAQAFNLLNRVNFDLPQAVVDETGSFGRVFSAKAPRQIQFALRYHF
jgi:hypothetical protein